MEELSRECLKETLDVFSGLKRIGGSEDEHRACGYLIKKLQEWGIPCRVYECEIVLQIPKIQRYIAYLVPKIRSPASPRPGTM